MNNWKETTLGEVGKVITGKTPSKDNPEHWGDLICFVTPSDLKNDSKYIYQTERYISQEGLKTFERILIPHNSIIVTCIGSDMGKVIINSQDCITNQQINSLIVNDAEYNRDFVYYHLRNSYSLLRMYADGGSTMPILNKSTFEGLAFSFPPLPEQKAIAAVLSSFDDKIELLRRQNKTLEKIAQTTFKEWFVNFTVNGKKLKIDNSTSLPKGWRMGTLGEELSVAIGGNWGEEIKTNSNDVQAYCLRGTDIDSIKLTGYSAQVPIRWIRKDSLEKRAITENDILIGGSGLGLACPCFMYQLL